MRYKEIRPLIKTGDLIEFRSPSWIGKLIRWKTGKPVNHTGLVMKLQAQQHSRLFIGEALEDGVNPKLLSARIETFKGSVYLVRMRENFCGYEPCILFTAMQLMGRGYDFVSLLKQLFMRVHPDMKRLFCSEYAYVVLRKCNILPLASYAPWPGEFHEKFPKVFHPPIRIK